MADRETPSELVGTLAQVRAKIAKFRNDKTFNEQNTKASLIIPILQVLGWDTNDTDEVYWEYKPKPKYNPVDFALMLQRAPALFVEAKALRDSLRDDNLLKQILGYASVAGVQWVVLTNGDEYRIYNANAPVPVEDKLFRSIVLSSDTEQTVGATLSLLSKRNLQEKKIGRLWASNFVDRQVRSAIDEMFSTVEPAKSLVHAIKRHLQGKLTDSEVRASIRRARLQLDFPEEPEPEIATARADVKGKSRGAPAAPRKRQEKATEAGRVTMAALIEGGFLAPPVQLYSKYRGHELTATVEADGSITLDGKQYWTPSIAGGAARLPFIKRDARYKSYPSTNGWTFWNAKDPITQRLTSLDAIRTNYLEKRKAEAARFTAKNANS